MATLPMRSISTPRGRSGVLLAILVLLVLGLGTGAKKDVYESRATAHYKLGMRYYEQLNYRGAVNEFTNAVDLVPKNPTYRIALGLSYLAVGSLKPAEEQFLRALKLNPADTDVHNYLGMVYGELREYAKAEQEYRLALADPGYLTPEKVYLNWGIMLRKMGDHQAAEKMFRKALDVSPRYVRGMYELGETLVERGNPEEALTWYLKSWEVMSTMPQLNLRIGEIYMELGDEPQAQLYLEKVIVAAPESEEADTARTLLDRLHG